MISENKLFTKIAIFTFYIALLFILFLRWYANLSPTIIITIGVLLLIVLNPYKTKINKNNISIFILIFILLIYLVINLLFTESHPYLFESVVIHTLVPYFSTLLFIYLNKNKKEVLNRYIFNPIFWIFNIYYIINFFIILKQISTPGFMVRNFSDNTLYLDQITGFMGTNGTARLMLLNISTLFINYYMFNSKSVKKYLSKIFFIIVLITSCYTSMYNDSRMYYFILVLFLLPLIARYITKNSLRRKITISAIKTFFFVIIAVIISIFLYISNNKFHDLIYDNIIDAYFIRTTESINNSRNNSSGGEERIELLDYALKKGNGYSIGKGIGSVPSDGSKNINIHFGLNDYNVRIYTGGIIYAALITLIYTISYYGMINKKNRNKLTFIYMLLILIIMAIYTQIFTYNDKNFLFAMIFFIYANVLERIDSNA